MRALFISKNDDVVIASVEDMGGVAPKWMQFETGTVYKFGYYDRRRNAVYFEVVDDEEPKPPEAS